MLKSIHAQRPAFLPNDMQIADQRPHQLTSVACAALLSHDSAVPSAAFGNGIGVADKRGPITGIATAEVSAKVEAMGVPPRGCPG